MHMRKYLFFLFFLFVLFSSCTTLRQRDSDASSYLPESFEWQQVCPGIERFDYVNEDFPLIYHAVKIDLNELGEGGSLKLTASRYENLSDCASRENCLVAINATPFDKFGELVGLHKEGGQVLSRPLERYAAIAFSENSAQIFDNQTSEELADYSYAFGGFYTVLEKGIVRQDFIDRQDSRSGAGLSADGKTLYLLVVEGEWTLQSAGLSYPQCGEIFKSMGCSDALEFDGGGSAELCINGRSVLSYKVRRVHGNSFGFTLR